MLPPEHTESVCKIMGTEFIPKREIKKRNLPAPRCFVQPLDHTFLFNLRFLGIKSVAFLDTGFDVIFAKKVFYIIKM